MNVIHHLDTVWPHGFNEYLHSTLGNIKPELEPLLPPLLRNKTAFPTPGSYKVAANISTYINSGADNIGPH